MSVLKSINENNFEFRTVDKNQVRVLAAGYIITPEGKYVNVLDSEDHNTVFSSYLRGYLEEPNLGEKDILHACNVLTQLNHIVYIGIKMGDKPKEGIGNNGFGVVLIPNNLDNITEKLRESCLNLLSTNRSVFGNKKIMELEIHDFNGREYTEDELVENLSNTLNSSEESSRTR